MVKSWTGIFARMLTDLGDAADDPSGAEKFLKGLEEIRVACEIRCVSDTPEPVPSPGAFEWLMEDAAKRAGLAVVERSDAPCLRSLIRFAAVPGENIHLFSSRTRLTRPAGSSDAGEARVGETVLWRAVSVCGVSTQARLWHDVGEVLAGQLDRFVSAYHHANR